MEEQRWGRRIRAFRKLKGYTQESFARDLGISVSVLGEIERGNRQPKQELVSRMATLFQISIDELTEDGSLQQ
ncbi:putative transcriptional regulator [Fictibacillus macauensis ZFHKF-1]|uniref:Putative transcriptional regulator n=1 Tax=Fictibacillus macauensis ZFHKF-1 TaxID=1196324 RepID=I8AEX4_9BACL|nr:helix-turn-helix transcriptional regulator [Fictibacillus macauensis]EIT84157.1 putative transcriptional regulator [Fictibacillus macauensis ZFHKF-1]